MGQSEQLAFAIFLQTLLTKRPGHVSEGAEFGNARNAYVASFNHRSRSDW